jgi:hypothetical protein
MIINKEPEPPENWPFVEELKAPRYYNLRWGRIKKGKDEADLGKGVTLDFRFPDERKVLDTAIADFHVFLKTAGIPENGPFKITVKKKDLGKPFESYCMETGADSCIISASDTEGIRRGLCFLEEQLLGADGPFLPIGVVERQPWLRNRISRCFFGPIKRPPLNRDELMDDVDYYPDAYLSRLAHEGINGLWLTIEFRDLCRTSLTEAPSNVEKRLDKLRGTVDKCLRYGIKTWVFCIEPASFKPDDPLMEKYPELRGASDGGGGYCFCPGSDISDRYLYESTHWLFSEVPGLGGLINISYGERPTTCLSSIHGDSDDPLDCPRCGRIPRWQILHRSLGAMQRGMRDANHDAELISWFYMPHANTHPDWMFDMAGHMPEGVVLQYNFESGAIKTQAGKLHSGGDYWLSHVAPSANFARISDRAGNAGTQLSAKIQVGCSHEVATIPFVPVPGLLYRKYKKMRELGCVDVMQCWYFGNYPGVMNRAAGALAYETFDDSEDAFLARLARPEWGVSADTVVNAWRHLAEGYEHYPLTNMFQYYGPMHDGVVWPLFLIPALKPLAPTWLTAPYPSGDTIGECLDTFTLSEALSLCEKMADKWQLGVELFLSLRPKFQNDPERLRDIDLVEALGIQFKSGRNILSFYYLRALLINGRTKTPLDVLDAMRRLVEDEIGHSKRMVELCEQDSRLGFHSEAEAYKYYPAKLRWRIEQLQGLLSTEFTEMRHLLETGSSNELQSKSTATECRGYNKSISVAAALCCRVPFPMNATRYSMPDWAPDRMAYRCGGDWMQGVNFRWRIDEQDGNLVFRAECQVPSKRKYSIIDLHLIDKAGIQYPWRFRCSPEISAADSSIINVSWGDIAYGEQTGTGWSVSIVIPCLSWDMDPIKKPAYLSVLYTLVVEGAPAIEESWPPIQGPRLSRLGLASFDPEHMARLEV